MVILNKEVVDGLMVGKYLLIIGEALWKINGFEEELNKDD
jgi:putative AlgH/UPF0301 family transcriptional regulator